MSMRARQLLGLFLLTGLCCLSLLAGQASAATNDGPDQNDFGESTRYGSSYPGVDRTVDYTVATSAFNTILTNTLTIYMPAATGAIVVTRHGCANFMPTWPEVEAFVAAHGGWECEPAA